MGVCAGFRTLFWKNFGNFGKILEILEKFWKFWKNFGKILKKSGFRLVNSTFLSKSQMFSIV